MRSPLLLVSALVLAVGCEDRAQPTTSIPQGPEPFVVVDTVQAKAALFPLVGRWFTRSEVARLTDPTLTSEAWCSRQAAHIAVGVDSVEVVCPDGRDFVAAIAMADSDASGVSLELRAGARSPLRRLRFVGRGPSITIEGAPCDAAPTPYQRFAEYEIVRRDVLGSRNCTQVVSELEATLR